MSRPPLPALACVSIMDTMSNGRAVLQRILKAIPGSMRGLALEAQVSHALLGAIRRGERRMTPATRDALVRALRRWTATCAALAEDLESAELEPGGHDEAD